MPVKEKECRLGWREGLTSDLVMTETSAVPMGCSGLGWTFRVVPS